MKKGFLSQYFEGVAMKKLRAVEINTRVSNQHELNGVNGFKGLLGEDKRVLKTTFLWLGGENEGFTEYGTVTWYDARKNNPSRTEYRLYFPNNAVMAQANEDDLLLIAKKTDEELFIVVVPENSSFESQLLWLFDTEDPNYSFNYVPIEDENDAKIDFAVRYILEELGIEIEEPDENRLDTIIEPYLKTGFPSTREFSLVARSSVGELDFLNEPDNSLMAWIVEEEKLFKRLERHIVDRQLKKWTSGESEMDVKNFISFSLSVQNRRKSRAGQSLEHHLEKMFHLHKIHYSRGQITENRAKPDFLFPHISCYHNKTFPVYNLSMLGVKSTCKDRWRQVLSEAQRIERKHLFTLEPGISDHQTDEMESHKLQLVIPESIHYTYKPDQQKWLVNLNEFIDFLRIKQEM